MNAARRAPQGEADDSDAFTAHDEPRRPMTKHSTCLRHWRIRSCRQYPAGTCTGCDETGSAVSLWVLLMVPVSTFAAIVAMAGPQRLAAEFSMREAADDVANMAVAWRYSHQHQGGPIPVFPPGCALSRSQRDELERLSQQRDAVDPLTEPDKWVIVEAVLNEYEAKMTRWVGACIMLRDSVAADLGYLGIDLGSMSGSYSNSLNTTTVLPCKISERIEVMDAVHVALIADWRNSGWAAAQVWPDGMRLGAESIGRRSRAVEDSELPDTQVCGTHLDVLDNQGRPVALSNPDAPSRKLWQSSPQRTTFSG